LNRLTSFIFSAVLLAPMVSLRAAEVVNLRCEYLENPLGIDVVKPGLSWRVEAQSGNGTKARSERGLKQTAYQILVASSEELLGMDQGDLWNSGKMESDQSIQVEYDGKPLGSGIQCYWKVRIWTSSTLDPEPRTPKPSSWSQPAMWTMGLLNPSDWQGEWIRFTEADTIKHIWYRKNFSLETVPVSAFAYLCSIGYHELYVNGKRIGTSVLSPGVTNLEKRALYVTYDITSKLKKGDNVIAVWTGPGWARSDGSYGKGVWKQNSIFMCQVNMSDGMSLHTDESWKCRISSSENLGLWKGGGEGECGGELIDARRHIANWNMPSCDDHDWANATTYQKSLILSAEMQEPDRKVETLVPVAITGEHGTYRIDMGRNFTGWFEIDLHNGKVGDTVKIMTANRPEETLEFNQESQYIFDSTGEGTFCHRFNYMAGRWVTIQGLSYRPALKDIRGYIVTNDRKRIGSFESSDPLLNDIYETDLRTYIACSVNGVTMDCPHRERFGYGEVALACTWGCAIPNFESAPYYRKAARDWFDVQREDGFVNTIAPQVYKGAGGTLWSSAPVTLSWEFYKAYGDRRQLEEAYLPMKKWLDFLHKSVSAEGVLTAYEKASRFLGDWATPHGSEYGDTPEAKLFNNCVYAYCLDVVVQAAGILGKPEDASTYSARLENLRESVHKHFFNEYTKTYIDGRQLAMAFPLYTGITPDHERQAVFANFEEEISKRKPYLDTGSSGLPILLKYIVEDAERADLLYPCLTRMEQPGYGFFLQSGETTWPEYWKITGEASRIHTCYTGIAGYFIKALGGIRPDPSAYGMQKFLIKPAIVGDLTWVSTHHDSFYGRIISNWKREGDKLTMEVTIPANTTATVYLPAGDAAAVTEGGNPIDKVKGVKFLRMEDGAAVYGVGSGSYRFQSTNEWRFALAMDATSGAKQPYPVLNGGAFDGPVVRESPDPLVGYRWKETNAEDTTQVYTLRPVSAVTDAIDAFVNLESATGATAAITVKGTGSIRLDFGVESAAWLEFDSPDLAGDVEMSISEYNQPAVVNNGPAHPVKTAVPVKHGNTYRLELNSELYEGVRFGWIHVRSFTTGWHITGVRLVCQTKPTNYSGSFSCSDAVLTKIWYTGAYGVKLNLTRGLLWRDPHGPRRPHFLDRGCTSIAGCRSRCVRQLRFHKEKHRQYVGSGQRDQELFALLGIKPH
jgi:alpha-L-rhamnosidase